VETCPVRAFEAWQAVARRKAGPLFRKISTDDGIGDTALTAVMVFTGLEGVEDTVPTNPPSRAKSCSGLYSRTTIADDESRRVRQLSSPSGHKPKGAATSGFAWC
jgi:hypothetical protein